MNEPFGRCDNYAVTRIFLGGWVLLVVAFGAVLTSLHAPFRTPLEVRNAGLLQRNAASWHAHHFVSGACLCSTTVLRHLAEREPLPQWDEQIVFVDDPTLKDLPTVKSLEAEVRSRGFAVTHADAASAVKQAGVRGVPTLLAFNSKQELAYSGGYGPNYDQSVAILQDVQSGHPVSRRPAVGCALGNAWKRRIALLQPPT